MWFRAPLSARTVPPFKVTLIHRIPSMCSSSNFAMRDASEELMGQPRTTKTVSRLTISQVERS